MNVAIRADGGPKHGYGHLVRTGALAEELLRRGYRVVYLTTTRQAVDEVCPDRVHVRKVSKENERTKVQSILKKGNIDTILTDSYGVDQEYQRDLSNTGTTVAVVQGDARYDLHCDILINGHIFAEDIEYKWSGEEPEWCLGPRYVLLREEFSKVTDDNSTFRREPQRAIILMGGSDVNNRTPEVMQAFEGQDITVDVIIGPGYDNPEEIRETAEEIDCHWDLHRDPDNMAELMDNADFAVSALGTTTYELIATNTPVIGLLEANNQLPVAQALSDQEMGLVVWDRDELHNIVETMISTPELRKDLYLKYTDLIDGRGTARIATRLTEQQS